MEKGERDEDQGNSNLPPNWIPIKTMMDNMSDDELRRVVQSVLLSYEKEEAKKQNQNQQSKDNQGDDPDQNPPSGSLAPGFGKS